MASSSEIFGNIIYAFLAALSVLSFVIILYKIWLTKVLDRLSDQVERSYKDHQHTILSIELKSSDRQTGVVNPLLTIFNLIKINAINLLKKNKQLLNPQHPAANFLSSTDIEQLGTQTEMYIFSQKKSLEKYLFVLSTTFSLAPLLGLLGTVWGISATFSQLQNAGNALSNDAVLTALAMALGTTIWGILTAIPSLIGYNYLKHRIEDYTLRMDQFSTDMLLNIEMQYRAVDVK